MVSYKLSYFAIRGRAEAIRYIFHQAGVDFEDHQIQFQEWPKLKPTMPNGTVPTLFVDGNALGQSLAIAAYLGRKFGLAGNDDFDAARCHMIAGGVEDFFGAHTNYNMAIIREQNMEKAKEIWAEIKKEAWPNFCKQYEKLLAESSAGWLVGDKVTWADLCVGEFMGRIEELTDPTALEDFPRLRQHSKRVHDLPNIKKYTHNRNFAIPL